MAHVFIERRYALIGDTFAVFKDTADIFHEMMPRLRKSYSAAVLENRCSIRNSDIKDTFSDKIDWDESIVDDLKYDDVQLERSSHKLWPEVNDHDDAINACIPSEGGVVSSQSAQVSPPMPSMLTTPQSRKPAPSNRRARLTVQNAAGVVDLTTVMIRNIPRDLSQQDFLQELDSAGFRGLYDFCYLPRTFTTGENQGFAFVNFISVKSASLLTGAWHRQVRFRTDAQPLSITAAKVQGLEANKRKWCDPRRRRVRNPLYRPFVVDDDGSIEGVDGLQFVSVTL